VSAIRTWTVVASAPISTTPALLVGLAGLVGLAFLFVGWCLARWARREDGPRSLVAVAGVTAVGAFLLIACGLSFRHYGGHQFEGNAYACDAWWKQVSTPHGASEGDDAPSAYCKRAAEDAIRPGVIEAGIGAVFVAGAAVTVLHLRRRRFNRRLSRLTRPSHQP
jgi:hypothetical protein